MSDPTDPSTAAVRGFSKDALSRTYRLEVASAIAGTGQPRVHASMIFDHLDRRVPLSKISDELNQFAKWQLLSPVVSEVKNSVFQVEQTVFFEMAARLELEVRDRAGM